MRQRRQFVIVVIKIFDVGNENNIIESMPERRVLLSLSQNRPAMWKSYLNSINFPAVIGQHLRCMFV